MVSKHFACLGLACTLALGSGAPAFANLGDGLVGGVVGGIVGGVIVNQANRNRAVRSRPVYHDTAATYQRQQNAEVQTALNYFGFPVGTPDGVMGGRSRAGIADFQTYLGYPATGDLSPFQQNLLVTSYNRAMAGGPNTMRLAAANPQGMRGLLIGYRDEMAGTAAPAAPQPAPVAAPAPAPVTMAAAPAPAPAAPEPAPAASTGLPAFAVAAPVATVSLASECNKVSLMSGSGQGLMTVADMSDPNVALTQQMCLDRSYALSQGEGLAAKVQGFSADQIAQQCGGFGTTLKPYVDALATRSRDEVLSQVGDFVRTSGMASSQLEATAKICLYSGYQRDEMPVAIGSALMLTALGDKPYAELVGHHLSQGYGTSKRPDLALGWYQTALDALQAGQPAVFAPNQPERPALIRKAAYAAAGRADAGGGAKVLPSFATGGAPAPSPAVATAKP